MNPRISGLSDSELLDRVGHLVLATNQTTAELLLHLAEVDSRRLYAGLGYPSLFDWCTRHLGFSEGGAYKRICVARAGREFPLLIERIREGRLHLSGAVEVVPKLTVEGAAELIDAACGKSKRDIVKLLADREPKPAAPTRVLRLPPAPAPPTSHPEPSKPPAPPPGRRAPHPEPLGAERYKVVFTADQALIDKLEEAKQLASHRIPDGDIGKLVDEALELLCEKLRKERFAELKPGGSQAEENPPAELAPGRVEKPSRHIPHRVRRAVVKRDGEQCTCDSPDGRCAVSPSSSSITSSPGRGTRCPLPTASCFDVGPTTSTRPGSTSGWRSQRGGHRRAHRGARPEEGGFVLTGLWT